MLDDDEWHKGLDLLRPVKRRSNQAREKARSILERQYEEGLSTLRLPWAQHALETIEEHCPHLSWEEKVRLFHDRTDASPESVVQAALFADWNRAHAGPSPGAPADAEGTGSDPGKKMK